MSSRRAVTFILLAVALSLRPQGVALGQVFAPPQPARSQAIDPLTASIHGRVTTADSGAPIRRAEVRAMSTSGISRLATTDGEGRFELRDMPAGQYRVTISKSGFVPLTYGQRRPFEASRPIDLKQGQRVAANVMLPRGGAITGRIYDAAGEPLLRVRVQALRTRTAEGRRRLEPVGPADQTDDTGSFRLYGLPPGDYYVTAAVPRPQIEMIDAPLVTPRPPTDVRSTMTTFYPGTPSLEEAQRVTLGAGGEVRADIQIGEPRVATVSGIVLSSSGAPAPDAIVSLRSDAVAMGGSALVAGVLPLAITGHTNPDGTFVLPNVPPGPYTLGVTVQDLSAVNVIRTQSGDTFKINPDTGQALKMAMASVPQPQTASMPLIVAGADITGLTVTAGSGGTVEGKFIADTGVTQPLPRGLEVRASSMSGSGSQMHMSGGETFRVMGINDRVYLVVGGLPEAWTVKRMLVDGTDMTDQPLDLRNGRSVDVQMVLTDRINVVTGSIADDRGRAGDARANLNVVIFPEDAKKWAFPSRHVRMARTDEQGAFRVSGLPGDERYLAVAVDYLEDGEWTDPEFLDQMKTHATGFALTEGERKNLDLRLVAR